MREPAQNLCSFDYHITFIRGGIHNPRVQNFKILFTSAHLRFISTYSLVQLLRTLVYTNQISNNTDHHGISYAFHSLS